MAFCPETAFFGCKHSASSRLIKPDRPCRRRTFSLEESLLSGSKAHSATAPTEERTGISQRQREAYDQLKNDPRFIQVEASPPGSSAWIKATLDEPIGGITELFIQYSKQE
jgi:hypothetical protein